MPKKFSVDLIWDENNECFRFLPPVTVARQTFKIDEFRVKKDGDEWVLCFMFHGEVVHEVTNFRHKDVNAMKHFILGYLRRIFSEDQNEDQEDD